MAAITLNNYCTSGLSAIGSAAAMVGSGASALCTGGGVEMMSHVPFMADRASYYGDTVLPPRARYIPPVVAADRLAARWRDRPRRLGRMRVAIAGPSRRE